jgi:hypothetical protein
MYLLLFEQFLLIDGINMFGFKKQKVPQTLAYLLVLRG